LLILSVIWQGGFSDLTWNACGAAICLVLLWKALKRELLLPPLRLLLPMSVCLAAFAVSSVWHGSYLENWQGTARAAIFLLAGCLVYSNRHWQAARVILPAGLLLAACGILSYCGLLPLAGNMDGSRLYGLFQYANATGIFLAASAFLAHAKDRPAAASLLEITLLLTQSVGAIAVYAVGWCYHLIFAKKKSGGHHLTVFICSAVCAAAVALCRRAGLPYGGLFFAALPFILWKFLRKPLSRCGDRLTEAKFVLPAGLAVSAIISGTLLLTRATSPLTTYLERLIHVSDGLRLLAGNPLGVGPGQWAFSVLEIQTSYYNTTLIHSGFVQVGSDAGWAALISGAVLFGCWYRGQPFSAEKTAALMILAHAALDISLAFFSVVFIFVCLTDTQAMPGLGPLPSRWAAVLALLLLTVAFGTLGWAETEKNQSKWLITEGDYVEAKARLAQPVLSKDTESLLMRLEVIIQSNGALDEFMAVMRELRRPNATARYLEAVILEREGLITEAADAALACAQASPYFVDGYETLVSFLAEMTDAEQEYYRAKMTNIWEKARTNENPLARFIPGKEKGRMKEAFW
jgi:hypothetical protein